jgi:hypothetical protein
MSSHRVLPSETEWDVVRRSSLESVANDERRDGVWTT